MPQFPKEIKIIFNLPGTAYQPMRALDQPAFDPGTALRSEPVNYLLAQSPEGWIGVMNPFIRQVSSFQADGANASTITLQYPENGPEPRGFCLNAGHIAVLGTEGEDEQILFFDRAGKFEKRLSSSEWSTGKGAQLLSAGNDVYYFPDQYPLKVARISPEDDFALDFLQWENLDHEARIDPQGMFINISYDTATTGRQIQRIEPNSGKTTTLSPAPEYRMLLLGLLGGDRAGATYFYGSLESGGPNGLFKLDENGKLAASWPLEQLAIDPEGKTAAHWFKRDGKPYAVIAQGPGDDQREFALDIPTENTDLAEVSPEGRAIFIRENEMGLPGETIALNAAGEEESPVPVTDRQLIVYRNQAPSSWLVLPNGAVLVPVLTRHGLSVVSVRI